MTATVATAGAEPVVLPDPGHPIRSFVLVLAVVAALLAGAGASAALHPRAVVSAQGGTLVDDGGRVTYHVQIRTDATNLRLVGAGLVDPAWQDVEVRLGAGDAHLDPEARAGFEPVDLDDQPVWLTVSGTPRCGTIASDLDLELRLRTWLGVERTVRVPTHDTTPRGRYCPEASTSWTVVPSAVSSRSLRAAAA